MQRRDFLKTTAAGLFYFQAAAPRRREVSVGKKRVKVIDAHGHFIAPEELEVVKDTPLARNVTNTQGGSLVLGPQRLRVLDDMGIDIQVLSHQGGWWYDLDRDVARKLSSLGCQEVPRTGDGSHRKWLNPATGNTTVVPDWGGDDPKLGACQVSDAVAAGRPCGVGQRRGACERPADRAVRRRHRSELARLYGRDEQAMGRPGGLAVVAEIMK